MPGTPCFFTRIFINRKGLLLLLLSIVCLSSSAQFGPPPILPCTLPGLTPSKPILICGNKPYVQGRVALCDGSLIQIPGCKANKPPPIDTMYKVISPLYYKFKCYGSGTFGFVISPEVFNANFDWQLYDITGKDPVQYVYSNTSIVISGNWSPVPGHTGTSAGGVPYFQCVPTFRLTGPTPTYAEMPELIQGHEYLLLVARKEEFGSGFTLTFEGGTADITDPLKPHMLAAKAECDGKEITIKLNKKISCASLTATGSEFSILPGSPAIISAATTDCPSSNASDEIKITLSSPLTDGNYQLIINNGTDGNTLIDLCDNPVPANETSLFDFSIPKPILADSIGKPDCMPDSVRLYFPKKISCASISPDGSDFSISGPQAVTVIAASGNCKNGKTDYVIVKFDKPITTKGNYQLTLKAGTDGSVIIDECGEESPPQTIDFSIADTVDAAFSYSSKLGCQRDTFAFSHNGAHDVNNWRWIFNKRAPVTTQTSGIIWPASGTNEIQLLVSNGTCTDSAATTIVLDNEVKAIFSMPDIICPEDKLEVINNSIGIVDAWRWNFDVVTSSNLKDPPPFLLPYNNREAFYTVKLVAYNNTIGCSDSTRNILTVLDNCLIAVPTAFTPNNDGLNDTFSPHNALKADDLVFKVYNRWGQLIFQSRTWRDKWDGKVNGVLQTTGIYVWMLSYINRDTKKQVFQKGTVALIR